MEALKALAVRRLPKLCQRISTEAAADLPARSASCRSGLLAFALALNKRLADDAGWSNRNLIFSPVSVYAALSLVAAGGRGRTLSEILGVLGAPSRDDLARSVCVLAGQALADRSTTGGPSLNFACAVWHDQTRTLKPAYIDAVVNEYKAQTWAVDFHRKPKEAGEQINAWVVASTNNLITKIVNPNELPGTTELVLANAIYFKGKWRKFRPLDGSTVEVPFMRQSRRQLIACHNGFKVLKLYYEEGQPLPAQPHAIYSMCIFLPDARDGLSRLTDMFACDHDFLCKHLPTDTVQVGNFRIPKFKIDFDTKMQALLRNLEIKDAFEPGKANFSDMVAEDDPSLALQEVVHKAVIEVNEEGTEAAAITACMMFGRTMCYRPPLVLVDFVADHPFAFFVMEELSGAILFAGHILDPSK